MNNPATTGGNPIKAFNATTTPRRPGKRATANSAPSGSPTKAASATAVRLTRSDNPTMAASAGSPAATKPSAVEKAAPRSCN
ncbi:hypothetical protein GCM10009416_05500 [Craurococcus roseus]|uniref:Uncharacterized protein n=1 Tax=Craurococcus roseus TaxID=77585 RepID=A0ABN1ENM8_9PROT